MTTYERHITHTEARKGHITVVQAYRELFETHFGKLLHEEANKDGDEKFYKKFRKKDTGETVMLKLCMRNKPRREIRLYLKKQDGSGYEVNGNSILVIEFEKGEAIISSRESGLKKPDLIFPPHKSKKSTRRKKFDRSIDDGIKANSAAYSIGRVVRKSTPWGRSGIKLSEVLRRSGYQCDASMDGDPFNSKATKKRYLEVHHLIPLKYQEQFDQSLNLPDNLCSLSPQAHRAIHYGDESAARGVLQTLLAKNEKLKLMYGISEDILFKMYELQYPKST
jgi:hypothetical protein